MKSAAGAARNLPNCRRPVSSVRFHLASIGTYPLNLSEDFLPMTPALAWRLLMGHRWRSSHAERSFKPDAPLTVDVYADTCV